jgi:hypothetical protein
MSDPLRGTPGIMGGTGADIASVVQIGAVQAAKERALAAFRQNIALPDVHVADRTKPFVPMIVGQDGAPITPERRAEMMRAAGVKPMFDENGKATNQRYTESFDGVIEVERIGESAERNRHQIRVVQTKELSEDALRQGNIGEATVAGTEGDLHIPGAEDVVIRQNCVYTSGHGSPVSPTQFLAHIREALTKLAAASKKADGTQVGCKVCEMSPASRLFAQRYLKTQGVGVGATIFGIVITIDPDMENEIRFSGDPAYPAFKDLYASVFIPKIQYERAAKALHASQADTDVIVIEDEEIT